MKKRISGEDFKLIERYLRRELTEIESQHFLERMLLDNEFSEQVKELKLLLIGVEEAGVRNEIVEIHRRHFNEKDVRKLRRFKWKRVVVVAASLVLLFGVAELLYLNKKQQTTLYSHYFTPDPGLMTAMGTTDAYDFERAMVDYKEGKYKAALTVWEQQLTQNPTNDTLLYFVGVAYQAAGDLGKAAGFLQAVVENEQSAFYKEANWYYGLVLIKGQKGNEAIPYIEKSGFKRAKILLEELQK